MKHELTTSLKFKKLVFKNYLNSTFFVSWICKWLIGSISRNVSHAIGVVNRFVGLNKLYLFRVWKNMYGTGLNNHNTTRYSNIDVFLLICFLYILVEVMLSQFTDSHFRICNSSFTAHRNLNCMNERKKETVDKCTTCNFLSSTTITICYF